MKNENWKKELLKEKEQKQKIEDELLALIADEFKRADLGIAIGRLYYLKDCIQQILEKQKEEILEKIEKIDWGDDKDRNLCLQNQPEIESHNIDDAYEIGWSVCREEFLKRLNNLKTKL